jgi:hypothetical protein
MKVAEELDDCAKSGFTCCDVGTLQASGQLFVREDGEVDWGLRLLVHEVLESAVTILLE